MADPEIWQARTMHPSFLTRAARLLKGHGFMRSNRRGSNSSMEVREKNKHTAGAESGAFVDGGDPREENIDRRRDVRSLPRACGASGTSEAVIC